MHVPSFSFSAGMLPHIGGRHHYRTAEKPIAFDESSLSVARRGGKRRAEPCAASPPPQDERDARILWLEQQLVEARGLSQLQAARSSGTCEGDDPIQEDERPSVRRRLCHKTGGEV